jgi:hypothetical protein
MFRSFLDRKYMEEYELYKGFKVKRAMIFDRPPVLTKLYQELGLKIPGTFMEALGKASKIHKENTGAASTRAPLPLPLPLPLPSPLPLPLPLPSSLVAARKALKDGVTINDIIGGYGKPINPYGLTREQQGILVKEAKEAKEATTTPTGTPPSPAYRPSTPNSPAYRPSTPNSPAYRPSTPPLKGGTRKNKGLSKIVNNTRRTSKKTIQDIAKAFSKVWNTHGKK